MFHRRRLLTLVALFTLLACAFSTETAEVWCRVAVGATMDLDDDDGFSFAYRPASEYAADHSAVSAGQPGNGVPAADAMPSSTIPDAPIYTLPHTLAFVPPQPWNGLSVHWTAMEYDREERAPRVAALSFARPPPRAPPIL